MLEIRKISKKYNHESIFILNNISLKFYEGKMTAIIGESGSGKSTLMNILGGLDLSYSGELRFFNKRITKKNVDNYRKNYIGFIFQSFNLISNLTAYENVSLASKIKLKRNSKKRIKEIFKELEILNIINKNVNDLSGGQRQRVAIARALINDPKVILADEPTGSLDQKNSEIVMKILKKLADKGKIVIIVTHSSTVASQADTILEMKNSKINVIKEEEGVCEEIDVLQKSKARVSAKNILSLTLLNMSKNKKRNFLITFASSIGILFITLTFYLNSGIKKYINREILINLNPKEIEVNKSNNLLEQNMFDKNDIYKLNKIENIEKIKTSTTISNNCSIIYNDNKKDLLSLTTFESIKNKKIKYGNSEGLVISEYLANSLSTSYENIIGSYITLYIVDSEKPALISYKLKIAGILKTENELLDNMNYAYINKNVLNNIYSYYNLELKISSINVIVDDVKNVDKVKKRLKQAGFNYSNSSKIIKKIFNYCDIISIILIFISGISLIVSSIMISIIMHINVIEKTKEIGILKSLGLKQKEIKKIFLNESSCIGLFSGLFGVILSDFISMIINTFTLNEYEAKFLDINFIYILISIFISIFICSLAGKKPSKRAAKLDPIKSLRYE